MHNTWQFKNQYNAREHINMDDISVLKMINNHSHARDLEKSQADTQEQASKTTENISVLFNHTM
ncbi:hypothetical protein MXB_2235 [Myxobolus squamalis]|nr:hypothetical protein MXB_2235 [Myxobolus squamalis]